MSSSNKNLKIYNSLSSQKEVFNSINKKMVGMYVCGPTVYNTVHLGNCRTFVSFDLIFRYLKHLGYKVRYVRNITDVGHLEDDTQEDKISKRAALEKLEPMEIVQKYTNDFRNTLQKFNLLNPNIEPTATGHIIDQIEMIEKIIKNGFAYVKNGSVYFDIKEFNKVDENSSIEFCKNGHYLFNLIENMSIPVFALVNGYALGGGCELSLACHLRVATENAQLLNRIPEPHHEILTLSDYRKRHAQYKKDPQSQLLHATHPLIAVWDDHEITNDTWKYGAENHDGIA